MGLAGIPVPPGAILRCEFFATWLASITRHPAWAAVVAAGPAGWATTCPSVQALVPTLALNEVQAAALTTVQERFAGGLLAVRSSSPEEDLIHASFAGGYTTRLGVTPEGLLDAVRACFASCLDARVLHYKHDHGFDPLSPSLAVVIQQQLHSTVAGVAFSLNPITNDHDEAVIDAAWGLGEAVVGGLTSPDHVVVHRPDGAILEHQRGAKQLSMWLQPDGGTTTREGYRSDERCLSSQDIAKLTGLVSRAEAQLGRPVDIEWAFADGQLYLLQARPITAYVPLPRELMTSPGAPRWLYMDASLSNGLTLNEPVSPLGLDWLREIFFALIERFVGPVGRSTALDEALFFTAGGRLYANLSHLLWVQSPEALGKGNERVDALMAAILSNIDADRYRSDRRPSAFHLRHIARLPRMIWASRHIGWRLLGALLRPRRARERFRADMAQLEGLLRAPRTPGGTIEDELRSGFDTLFEVGFAPLWAGLIAGMAPVLAMETLAGAAHRALAMRLQRGFGGNVVRRNGGRLGPPRRDAPTRSACGS